MRWETKKRRDRKISKSEKGESEGLGGEEGEEEGWRKGG